ncbi:PmeII family type II restriction endonuclease [Epilithonimonas xixisoli]|uniref:Type II restriction endonuclease EcoO109I-like protein n=1 Tax=Epilithonimonas xixisoli TaxID=1476462 RepID=A0A4R8I8H0_9FLAO|nr:PmeII family type II restriction endonuclease [Epilithonimonas xixisoli]TDX82922.1 type II restriction endonuclease EcoO109I-like protein [Epilithonimonas xixisoli]
MKTRTQEELIQEIVEYFKVYIFENHITASINTHSKLKSYNINPIVVKYLSKVLENDYTAIGVAKALFYPRVLGTSINTSFGTRIQNMFVDLKIAEGSLIKGMDIEFLDKIDNRRKWCQLKSGPNTINSEDVKPLIKKFTDTINLARTNKAFKNINNTDFMVGVLYGEVDELSMHYKLIDKTHPVIIGKEFWHRVTGFPDFYDGLVENLQLLITNIDTQDLINVGVEKLSKEIESSQLFDFKE